VTTVYIKAGVDLLIGWLQHTYKKIFDFGSTQVPVRRAEEDVPAPGALHPALTIFCK